MDENLIPKISVIVVTYNHEKYIRTCIESLLCQTLMPAEIIVCDDHSTDNSWCIISEYRERYPQLIKTFRHEQNIGMVKNGQFGRRVYNGNLVSLIEGDDRWLPRKLELEWNALRECPEASIAYSNVYVTDAEGNRIGIWDGGNQKPPTGDVFMEVFTKRVFGNVRNLFRNQLMQRFAFDEEGYCDESLESFWDWDMKIRLAARFRVAFSGEALVEYRRHSEGFSQSNHEKHLSATVKIYEKYLPLLKQRSRSEEIWGVWNIESLIALRQFGLPSKKRLEYYLSRNVYERNVALLNELPKKERRLLEKRLSPVSSELIGQVINEEVELGNRRHALKYCLYAFRNSVSKFNPRLVLRLCCPGRVHSGLSAVNRLFQGKE